MKKLLSVLVIVAIVATCVGVFAGCDNGPAFKVGVLHINPVNSTSGYTYAHQQGIEYMQKELGLSDDQIVIKDSIVDTDVEQTTTAIEELVAEGCDLIIGTSFGYMDPMLEAAQKYPNVLFSHGTGFKHNFADKDGKNPFVKEGTPNNNMNNYFGRIYQARYLSGLVAGLSVKQGANLGYVVAHSNYIAECSSGINAFALGVQAVNEDAKVCVKALGSWFNPSNESEFAKTLMSEPLNCELIAQHCDTKNPPTEAKTAGKLSIGYNSDMEEAINDPSCLTSVVWHWGVYYKAAVEAAMKCFDAEGNFLGTEEWVKFGNYYGSFADGLFGLSGYSSRVSEDAKAVVALAEAEMKKGTTEWDVFTNKALSFKKGDDGKWTMSKVDRQLQKSVIDKNNVETFVDVNDITVANITGNMPWYVKGVKEYQ